MTALSTETRVAITTAMTGLGLKVYSTVPDVPRPPCIVCVPDTPWIRPSRVGSYLNYEVRWRLMVVVSPRTNEAAQTDTETAVDKVLAAIPDGYQVTGVGAPTLTDIGAQGTVTTTEIQISVQVKE
jgi:hypothetical protein